MLGRSQECHRMGLASNPGLAREDVLCQWCGSTHGRVVRVNSCSAPLFPSAKAAGQERSCSCHTESAVIPLLYKSCHCLQQELGSRAWVWSGMGSGLHVCPWGGRSPADPFPGSGLQHRLETLPRFFRRFINFLSEPEPSFELPAKIILFCWFVVVFFPSLRPHGAL